MKQTKSWLPIYIVLAVVVVILATVYTLMTRKPPAPVEEVQKPYPTAIPGTTDTPPPPGQGDQYEKSTAEIAKKESSPLQKDAAISHLLDILPYNGQYFSMSYDIKNNIFNVTIPNDHREEGEKEFTAFLNKNKIDEQSWFTNLKKQYN